MNIYLLTLFPKIFQGVFAQSIIGRAQKKNLVKINLINIRDFAKDVRGTVDDKPYGGGRGMVLKVDVVISALESITPKPYSILLSASGKKYNQDLAKLLAKKKDIAIICGHYEGTDARLERFVDEVVSIGDFILTGGEIAAMAIVDSVVRLVPGVIRKESLTDESFSANGKLLEYPQFTRPEIFRGLKVPAVLLSGNHEQIEKWRNQKAVKRTEKYRPDILNPKS